MKTKLLGLLVYGLLSLYGHSAIAQSFSGNGPNGAVYTGLGPNTPPDFTIPVDVFLVAGQSNARGRGTSSLAPLVPPGSVLMYCSGGTPLIQTANDPICSAVSGAPAALTGSAWPAFGLAYFNATGRKILFVNTSIGGTTQTVGADIGSGNWDTSGTLVAQAISSLNTALTSISAAGYFPIYRGILWIQGETDGTAINGALISQATYTTALQAMLVRFRSAVIGGVTYPQMPFYMFRIGTDTSQSDVGLGQIRAAEDSTIDADPFSLIVSRIAVDFPALGYQQASSPHYTQAGYNLTGQVGGRNVATAQAAIGWQSNGSNLDLAYTAGNVIVGYPVSSGAPLSVNTLGAQLPAPLVSKSTQISTGLEIVNYAAGSVINFRNANGSAASPSQIVSGTTFGGLAWRGLDGSSAWSGNAAAILVNTSDTWVDATHHGTRIYFRVTPNASATLTDTLYLENDLGIDCAGVTGGDKGAHTFNCGTLYSGGVQAATLGANIFTALQTINLNATSLAAPQTGGVLQLGNADSSPTRLQLNAYGNVGLFTCLRADGTNAVQTAIQTGDELCALTTFGYDGTAISSTPQVSVEMYGAQVWAVGAHGTYLQIGTTPNGSVTRTAMVRFQASGGLSVGNANITIDGGAGEVVASGSIFTVAAPTVAASQVGLGGTTAASSNCGSLSGAAGCLVINVVGMTRYVPYY